MLVGLEELTKLSQTTPPINNVFSRNINPFADYILGGVMVSQSLRKGGKASPELSPLSRLKKLIGVRWVTDSDVGIDVLDEVEEIKDKYCKNLDSLHYDSEWGIYESVNLYECKHPSLGKFYLVWSAMRYSDMGEGRVGFMLTRNLSEAKEAYNLFRAI
jgi:hypothetical protein